MAAAAAAPTRAAETAIIVAHAAIEGGFRALEITLSIPGAVDLIRRLAARYRSDGIAVGAGTVLDGHAAQVQRHARRRGHAVGRRPQGLQSPHHHLARAQREPVPHGDRARTHGEELQRTDRRDDRGERTADGDRADEREQRGERERTHRRVEAPQRAQQQHGSIFADRQLFQ